MEFNPVALNEVLAYSYISNPGGTGTPTRVNRFFAELVNTQTSPELSVNIFNAPGTTTNPGTGFNPGLDLGGYVYNTVGAPDPYSGGTWDIVFTADDPYSRPDPYRGQLVPYANLYAATPLSQYSFTPPGPPPGTITLPTGFPTPVTNQPVNPTPPATAGTPTDGFNVILQPLDAPGSIPAPVPPLYPQSSVSNPAEASSGISYPIATNYFYVIGNSTPRPPAVEVGSPTPRLTSGVRDEPSATSRPRSPPLRRRRSNRRPRS